MADLSRRKFLIAAASVPAALAIPALPLAPQIPILWGDGIHDDAPAINALIRRLPVDIRTPTVKIVEDMAYLANGNYRIHDAIRFPSTCSRKVSITHSFIKQTNPDQPVMRFDYPTPDWPSDTVDVVVEHPFSKPTPIKFVPELTYQDADANLT